MGRKKIAIVEGGRDWYDNLEPYGHAATLAAEGFKLLGYEVKLVRSGELSKNILAGCSALKGDDEFTNSALRLLGKRLPTIEKLPASLQKHSRKNVKNMTLGELRSAPENKSFLIYPIEGGKHFEPHVFGANVNDFYCMTDDVIVQAEAAVSSVCEFQLYILNDKIVSKNTEPKILQKAEAIIKDFVNAPAAYCMQIATKMDRNKTPVLKGISEFATITYPHGDIEAREIAQMSIARWRELCGN